MITNDINYYCWLKWEVKVNRADHDGYCTDSDNIEEIYYINRYYEYELNDNEYYTLIWLNNECNKIFINKYFIKAVKPLTTKTPIKHNGSDYCNYSWGNALCHEILRTPIKILDFNIDNIRTKRKKFRVDSSNLKQLLQTIIHKNEAINRCLENVLPIEIIDLILKFIWNDYFD